MGSTGDSPLLIDLTLGNDEIEIAEARFRYLAKDVDLFIVGESRNTFSGAVKPMHFSRWFHERGLASPRFRSWEISVPAEMTAGSDRWAIEQHSRDTLLKGVAEAFPDSVIIFSDIDEVPSREQLSRARCLVRTSGVMSLPLRQTIRFANLFDKSLVLPMSKAKILNASAAQSNLRYLRAAPVPGAMGCHFSYLGMKHRDIVAKHAAYSHAELDLPGVFDRNLIKLCDTYGLDHRGKFGRKNFGLLKYRPKQSVPKMIQEFCGDDSRWFREEAPQEPLVARLRMSHLLTEIIEERRITELPSPLNSRYLGWKRLLWSMLMTVSGLNMLRRVMGHILYGDHREGRAGLLTSKFRESQAKQTGGPLIE